MDWRRLNQQQAKVKTRLEKIEAENQELQYELEFHRKRAAVLEKEKQVRVDELARLRADVRSFTENVRQSFEAAQPEVKAYLGGELCAREYTDKENNILLIDRGNPVQTRAIFTGAKAFVAGPASYIFFVMRPLPENSNRVRAVAMSQLLHADEPGLQEWDFFDPIAVHPGDFIAIYAEDGLNLPYDCVGTGDVISVQTSRPKVGDSTYTIDLPQKKDSRAYSFGGSGYIRLVD